MKDTISASEYFADKIEKERKRIDKFEKALRTLEPSNEEGMRIGKIHLSNIYLNCIKLMYSKDRTFQSMLLDYVKFLEYYSEVCTPNDSMYDIIDILSIGVLLQNKKNMFVGYLEEVFLRYGSNDGMIVFLMDYLMGNVLREMNSEISYFNELLESEEKAEILEKELASWYEKHSDAYWYNSHALSNQSFCGYWCFEIAALVEIFHIDETSFRGKPYYPYESTKADNH